MKQLQYSEQEEQALVFLLDAACRWAGLDAANRAAVWQQKLMQAEKVVTDEPDTDIDL